MHLLIEFWQEEKKMAKVLENEFVKLLTKIHISIIINITSHSL